MKLRMSSASRMFSCDCRTRRAVEARACYRSRLRRARDVGGDDEGRLADLLGNVVVGDRRNLSDTCTARMKGEGGMWNIWLATSTSCVRVRSAAR